jgi:hypothetical protein
MASGWPTIRGMIEREFTAGGTRSSAFYSDCMRYRYGLRRVWNSDAQELLFVMLNPSTASERANDPTIERCQRRAQRLGFGGIRIANLFAFRATRPTDLKRAVDPVGPENDALLRDWSGRSAVTIAAWGVHGTHLDRARRVMPFLRGDVRHLGLTRDGHPRHPLYVSYDTLPMPLIVTDQADA